MAAPQTPKGSPLLYDYSLKANFLTEVTAMLTGGLQTVGLASITVVNLNSIAIKFLLDSFIYYLDKLFVLNKANLVVEFHRRGCTTNRGNPSSLILIQFFLKHLI